MTLLPRLSDISFIEILDIGVVTLLLYGMIVWSRRSQAKLAIQGIALLGGIYVLSSRLGLQLTAWIFQGFFAVFLVVLGVVFQRELRKFLEQVALWGLRRRSRNTASEDVLQPVVSALEELRSKHIGALLVIPGNEPIDDHTEGGTELNGKVSETLLLSLFDPHSPSHDGAVILEGEQVTRFSVHLPLSTDFKQLNRRGTRHSAALGLAEHTDAFCIVVSEEHGKISVAHNGRLRQLRGAVELSDELRTFFAVQAGAESPSRSWLQRVREKWKEPAVAFGLSLILWLIFVSGTRLTEEEFQVPVAIDHVPAGYAVDSVKPATVSVILSGSQRDFYLLDAEQIQVVLDGFLIRSGRRSFRIDEQRIKHPHDLEVVEVLPPSVQLSVRRTAAGGGLPVTGKAESEQSAPR